MENADLRKKKESKVAKFVGAQIELLKGEKTQHQIAAEAGYAKPNIITMFKKGDTRLPLANINRIAKALETDPVRLTRMALMEYEPEIWAAISEALGDPITNGERKVINRLRELAAETGYEPSEDDYEEALKAYVGKIETAKRRAEALEAAEAAKKKAPPSADN